MAETKKTLIGNIKGPQGEPGEKGDQGDTGATGQRGSGWTQGMAITGTDTAGTVFPESGIADALVNDNYLNTSTGNTYRCILGGDASTAEWVYTGNLRGPKGEAPDISSTYVKKTDYATTETAGIVKPDGKTIKVGEGGEIIGASSGFTGTKEEYEAAYEAGEIEVGTIVNITDDYEEKRIPTDNIFSFFPKSAASHNALFRGKDLTNEYSIDEICGMISDGTFEDLYIGDYFDITINAEGSEVVRCLLAGFNTYLHNGDTDFSKNHAVVVTKNCLNTLHAMNPTNTTAGGFAGSDMWTTVIPLYNTAFGSVLGSHLLSHRTLLTTAINADLDSNAGAGFKGASSSWAWQDTKLSLLSEIQVHGTNICSSSLYDGGCDNLQLPLFALDQTAKVCGRGGNGMGSESTKQWYWLRNVVSASQFADADAHGYSFLRDASYSYGVRPLFCIG